MKQLLKFLKPFWGSMAFLMVLYAVHTACALFMPYFMSGIVENGIRAGNMNVIWTYGGIMLGLAVAAVCCALISNKVSCELMAKFSASIRRIVFEKVNSLTFEQFSDVGTGSLITRSTDDIGWLEEVITQLPYVLISVPIMFVGGVVLSFSGDWVLALILLAASPIVLVIVYFVTRNIDGYWTRSDQFVDVQNKIIRERLSGIRVIRAFDKDRHEHKRAEYATREMCKCFVRSNSITGSINPLANMLLNFATVGIIYVGAVRLQSVEWLKAGDIIATIQYIALICNAVLIMSWTLAYIPHIKVSMRRINEVLDMDTGEVSSSDGRHLDGDISFEHVYFAYGKSENDALKDINIDVKKGEIVGIIGGTGSGKTTLVKLIMAFYNNVRGKRTMGGIDYSDINAATVRDNVSIALQKSMIFEGTVEENVKMGNRDASEEATDKVVAISQLNEFVKDREEGMQYKLMQAGSNISGGQKQRINIARTVLKDASVYIFDDSFSALDFLTESKLRRALNKYLDGKTQIVITQRAATAMHCDKIYVMDRGEIVGSGTHKQLLNECEVYREIYDSQLGGGVYGRD